MYRLSLLGVTGLLAVSLTLMGTSTTAEAGNAYCPPPPIHATLPVCPPCRCCNTTVEVCVPGCCTEAPCVSWRDGLFGRSIGIYTWPCCDHSVKVVVNRRGEVKVKG